MNDLICTYTYKRRELYPHDRAIQWPRPRPPSVPAQSQYEQLNSIYIYAYVFSKKQTIYNPYIYLYIYIVYIDNISHVYIVSTDIDETKIVKCVLSNPQREKPKVLNKLLTLYDKYDKS